MRSTGAKYESVILSWIYYLKHAEAKNEDWDIITLFSVEE